MAGTKVATIFVAGLKTVSTYADKFVVEVYSDIGLTTLITSQTSAAVFNGPLGKLVQKDLIAFPGLVFGTTYYLRAGVVSPVTGTVAWSATFTEVAGTPATPSATYGGTFTSTTSGITYQVTPASAPSDLDHYEAIWTYDGSTPAQSTKAYIDSLQVSGTQFAFFAGGYPGQNITAFVRAVNTGHTPQAWTSLGTIAVASTWSGPVSGTLTGTLADGSYLGSGGGQVYGSGGNTGLGSPPVGGKWNVFGNSRNDGGTPNTFYNDTQGGGFSAQYANGIGGVGVVNTYRGGTARDFITGSGHGFDGSPSNAFDLFGNGQAQVSLSGTPAWIMNDTTVVTGRGYEHYSGSGAEVVYDRTGGANRTLVNSSGYYGIGGVPTYQLELFGGAQGRATVNGSPAWRMNDTTVSTGREYMNYSGGGVQYLYDNTAAAPRNYMSSTGRYAVGATPLYQFEVYGIGQGRSVAAGSPAWFYADTTASTGRTYIHYSNVGPMMLQDNTAGVDRIFLNASAQYGIGANPGYPLEVFGQMARVTSNGAYVNLNDTTGGTGREYLFYSSSGLFRGYDRTGGVDRVYVDSNGKFGLSGTPTTDWMSVQGVSVVGPSKELVPLYLRHHAAPDPGASAAWYNLGRWTGTSGSKLDFEFVGAHGYSSGVQDATGKTYIHCAMGNAAASTNNTMGYYYSEGGAPKVLGVKLVAISGQTGYVWDVYVYVDTFTGDGYIEPRISTGATFVWNAFSTVADPGAASTTITVLPNQLNIRNSVRIGDGNPPAKTMDVAGTVGVNGTQLNGASSNLGIGTQTSPSYPVSSPGDMYATAGSAVKMRVNNTAGRQFSFCSV